METNPDQKTCRNCSAPMEPDAKFCSACSQKYTTGKVTIGQLTSEFFSQYFNLDSKLFKTVAALFIPGKLTTEYFKGRHKTYSSPLQLFIVTGVLLFAFVSYQTSQTQIDDLDMLFLKEDLDWLDFISKIDSAKLKTDSIFPQSYARAATDSLLVYTIGSRRTTEDSIDLNMDVGREKLPKFSKRDLLYEDTDQIIEKYAKGWPFWKVMLLKQGLKFKDGVRVMIEYFVGNLSLTLFFMMPFLALGLRILYFRRDYYYVEHLIFAFHYHAFAFLGILLISVFSTYAPKSVLASDVPDIVVGFSIFGIVIFLYLAMLKVYQQGMFKTFIKVITLLIFYLILMIFFSAFSFILSFLLF